ncbi:MAG: DUF362 domain-containing protein [Acidobacteria bacterium]|nr:DUF362 domain-containing protein [Acidobacteriota bacterium]
MSRREKVLIHAIDAYDTEAIRSIITGSLREFDLKDRLHGRLTIKPNVVMAHHRIAPSAFTRPEFLSGLIEALKEEAKNPPSITIAEKCGSGLPTTRMFRRAGYRELKKKYGVALQAIEEASKRRVILNRGKIHSSIRTAAVLADRDFLVYAPKLKSNVLCQGLSAAIKLNVGILLDKERMRHHNYDLDEKIVDLLEVGFPDFIATDGIEMACGGNQLTQHGRPLGIIVTAVNPVAHDAVCAHILNLDPAKIGHIRLAHERGYGPMDLSSIEIVSDIPLDRLRNTTRHFDLGFLPVSEVDTNFRILSGEPYCTGGCHGVFLDWLYMIKDRKPRLWKNLPPWTVVIGRYTGDVDARRVMLIGSCTQVTGRRKWRRAFRVRGCPPRHKDLVLWLFLKAGIVNPLFRFDLILDGYFFLFLSWCRRIVRGKG